MARPSNWDVHSCYDEFSVDEGANKCHKARCKHCGFVRAKNTTRQLEHLQECASFLATPDGVNMTAALAATSTPTQDAQQATPTSNQPNFLSGLRPNSNFTVNRRGRGAVSKRGRGNGRGRGASTAPHDRSMAPPSTPLAPRPGPTPSLTSHLLTRDTAAFSAATQQTFLSHAGGGTLSASALDQWLAQDAHFSRGYISFVGSLVSKIRLPQVANTQFHPVYRTMDLLISALNNVRREMSFFEITATKYNLQIRREDPSPITKAYLDLFVASSAPSVSLLEGMVVLWATEHCYLSSWTHAATFSSSLSQPFSYATPGSDSHVAALNQSLIPNWTSPAFAKFVQACRAVVDELANAQTTGNGREEMSRCEGAFRQVLWLWERTWPDVDGMGDKNETGQAGRFGRRGDRGGAATDEEIADADADDDGSDDDGDEGGVTEVQRPNGAQPYVSPYAGQAARPA